MSETNIQLVQELHSGIFSFVISLVQTKSAELGVDKAKQQVATYLRELADQIEDPTNKGNTL